MKKGSCLLGILLIVAAAGELRGQESEIRFHHIDVEDGLSHSLVMAMEEDSLGFLWFGTQDGLNRYDGYEFRTYYKGASNRTPSDSWIRTLYIDRRNQLWILYTGLGLERYDPFSETFHRYEADRAIPGSISSSTYNTSPGLSDEFFFEDSDGALWIGTDDGLNRYHREADTFEVFLHSPDDMHTLSDNRISVMAEDSLGFLWVGTSAGLNCLDRKSGEFKRLFRQSSETERLNNQLITSIYCHPDGSLWVGTFRDGLYIVKNPHSDQPEIRRIISTPLNPQAEPSIFNIILNSTGHILVGSENGLYVVDQAGDRYSARLVTESRGTRIDHLLEDSKGCIWFGSSDVVERSLFRLSPDLQHTDVFHFDEKGPFVFSGGKVQFLHENKTGLLWIGTEKAGLHYVDLNARQFRTIDSYPERGYYISHNEVYSIYEDDNRQLYLGTKTELNRIDLRDGSWFGFNNSFDLKRNINYEYSTELPARLIGVIEECVDGQIWLGAFDYKVSLYDPVSGRFLNFHHNESDPASFLPWSLRSICVTRDRQVYFGSMEQVGLCRLNADGYSFTYYPVVPTGNDSGTNDAQIRYIFEDSDGILWLGTSIGGLNRFDPAKGRFTHFVNDPADATSLSDNRVKCILEPEIHGDGQLWIGTQNGGLNKFDKSTQTFKSFTMQDGLPGNTVHGILEDKTGNLWMSTNRGLVQFDPLTERIRIYTAEDGLVGNEFNEGAFFKNQDGVMYFGGTKGVNYFLPEEIKEKTTYTAPVVITGFSVSGKQVLPNDTIRDRVLLERSILFTREITLSHRERFISLNFASLDYSAPNKIRYRYQLEGFETNMNEVDANQRFISYTNLPSGTYTLLLEGSDSDGNWAGEQTELVLRILPPFWQTTWFKLLVASVIILIFLLILQIRTQILKNQKRHLEQEVEARTRDLKEANRLLAKQNDEIQVMAEKLHESDQMKLKFFTNISHEFRTPLTLIMGPTEKLLNREKFEDVPAIRQELELMYRNQRRLFKLINQLLEVRRVESGTLKLSVAEDDIAEFLGTIYQLFIPYAEKKNIDFQFRSDPASVKILFDADKIEKIFYNLLSNAFKYTPPNGAIQFFVSTETEEGGEWLRTSVTDSGPGIDEEHLPHIFERFYQITKKHGSGRFSSGIGLSLSRDLVELHHGRIGVESGPNGTTFSVLLPMNREVYSGDEVLQEPDTDQASEYITSMLETYDYTTGDHPDKPLVGDAIFTILVIEDNLDMQKFLYSQLSDSYRILLAQNGAEGIEICRESMPDLILSDIMMPEMDGFEFCRQIKGDLATSHVPIILLTAKSGAEDQIRGLEQGADDYITKPFSAEALRLKVRNILENRKKLADKFSSALSYIPENIKISEIDQGFLEKLIKLVEDNMDDSELSGDVIACEMGMSKGNLYKKLKTLTGMTVNIFVRTIRLKVAARLLKQGNYNISEVAYAVGFNNPKYFSTCFSEMFSVSPKEYMK